MDEQHIASLREQLEIYRENLRILETRRAKRGGDLSLEDYHQHKDVVAEIGHLEAELAQAEAERARRERPAAEEVSAPPAQPTIPPSRPFPWRRAAAGVFVIVALAVLALIAKPWRWFVPPAGATRVWEKDGAVMVYVPAGEFTMGSPEDEGDDDEHPQHTVYLSAFWMDQTEVTNERFARFADAAGYSTDAEKDGWGWGWTGSEWKQIEGADWRHPDGPDTTIADKMDHPVMQISWRDAQAYCQWAGKRLPTEAEWEKAARGNDRRTYPWGEPFDGSRLNFCDVNCEFDYKDSGADDGYQRSAPVGSYPGAASPYGALDMAGNVWEWCQDWYGSDYYAGSPQSDPQGPDSGEYRVVRGGSWFDVEWRVRSALRFGRDPVFRDSASGFRCVSLAS